MTIHGWNAISDETMGLYAQSCSECASDDEKFKNFKQNSGYTTILEGAPKLFFDYYLQAVKSHENYKTFLDNIDKFRINDTLGNPDNFLVDDSNKVEEWYSSNIIVYIKKEKN